MRMQVLSPWIGDGLALQTSFRPAVCDSIPLSSWSDVTGTPSVPPTPNLAVIEAEADPAVVAAILDDPAAGAAVLWADDLRPPDEPPSEDGYAETVAAFAAAIEMPPEAIYAVVGESVNGRTRRAIAGQVAAWLRDQ